MKVVAIAQGQCPPLIWSVGLSCPSLKIITRISQMFVHKTLSQEDRVSVKVAVAAAIAYIKELYEGISLRDLLLEEIEYSDASDKWLVTIGFSPPTTKDVSTSVILPSNTSRELSRLFKTVIIDAVSGKPDSMKIITV
jgi:hypothetical protein